MKPLLIFVLKFSSIILIHLLVKIIKKPVSRLSTHSAEFAANDENPAFVEHTGVQMQHVVYIYSHKILCQVSLGERRRGDLWLILLVLITSSIELKHEKQKNNQKVYSPIPLS